MGTLPGPWRTPLTPDDGRAPEPEPWQHSPEVGQAASYSQYARMIFHALARHFESCRWRDGDGVGQHWGRPRAPGGVGGGNPVTLFRRQRMGSDGRLNSACQPGKCVPQDSNEAQTA